MGETAGSEFVDRIEQQLLLKNLKRTAFARSVGVTNQAFTDWKRRGTIPAADIALRIADALNIDLRWLITGKEPVTPPAPDLPPAEVLALANDICRLPAEYRDIILQNVEAFKKLCFRLEKAASQNIG